MRLAGIGALALLLAGAASPPRAETLRVTGRGGAEAAPDQAVMTLAIESGARLSQSAQEETDFILRGVVERLKELGVSEQGLDVSQPQVTAIQGYQPVGAPGTEAWPLRVQGYVADRRVEVTTDQPGRVGEMIEAGAGAGAQPVGEVTFGLKDEGAARRRAVEEATRRAEAEARRTAAARGVRLGPAVSRQVERVSVDRPRIPVQAVQSAWADASAPEAGAVRMEAQVAVTYRIEPPARAHEKRR